MRVFALTFLVLSIALIGLIRCETTQETMKPEPEPEPTQVEPEPTQVEPEPPEQVVNELQDHIINIMREAGHERIADKIKETGIFENPERKAKRPVVTVKAQPAAILGFKDVNEVSVLVVQTFRGKNFITYNIYTIEPVHVLAAMYPIGKHHTFKLIIRGRDGGTIMAEFP